MGEFTFEKIPFIDLIISGNSGKTTMIRSRENAWIGLGNAKILQDQLLGNPVLCNSVA